MVSNATAQSRAEPDPPPASPLLLSPAGYDDDASSLRSLSEQDSDSEDDEFLRNSRSTLELNAHDRAVLDDEEELEKLLTTGGSSGGLQRIFSSRRRGSVRIGKKERRRRRKARKANEAGDERERGELMFEMEERYRDRGHDPDSDEDNGSTDAGIGTPSLEMGRYHSQVHTTILGLIHRPLLTCNRRQKSHGEG